MIILTQTCSRAAPVQLLVARPTRAPPNAPHRHSPFARPQPHLLLPATTLGTHPPTTPCQCWTRYGIRNTHLSPAPPPSPPQPSNLLVRCGLSSGSSPSLASHVSQIITITRASWIHHGRLSVIPGVRPLPSLGSGHAHGLVLQHRGPCLYTDLFCRISQHSLRPCPSTSDAHLPSSTQSAHAAHRHCRFRAIL